MRVLFALLALAAVALLIGLWLWRGQARELEQTTRRGLERLAAVRDPAQTQRALRDWQRENATTLLERRDDWVAFVVSNESLDDPAVRRLLTAVTGADYGDRRSDWERWNDSRRRLIDGKQPATPAKERVELTERWRTAIGLTSFFSTIVPIDGRIYAASLGAKFDDATDSADGIVRIDGRSGDAQIIFEPPDKGPRDILGIAFAGNVLLAACRNGFVYCTDLDGKLRWKANLGTKLASIPLVFDANRDGAIDVAVVTANGRVAALTGDSGKSVWTTPIELAPRGFDMDAAAQSPEQAAVRASLALGNLPGSGGGAVFVSTIGGELYALTPLTGKVVWRQRIDHAILSGPAFLAANAESEAAFVVGDALGRLWSTVRTAKSVEARVLGDIVHPSDPRIVASLRTLGGVASAGPHWIACSAGDAAGFGGAIHRVAPSGAAWCFTPGGAIWASPAIADVNGDGRPEVIVASSNVTGDGDWWAWLSVVSESGHLLRQVWLDAAVECPPVVADVDGDGALEILVADRSGLLHCIETGKAGPVEWGLAAGDPRNSRSAADAYSFSQIPFGHQSRWRPR